MNPVKKKGERGAEEGKKHTQKTSLCQKEADIGTGKTK